MVGIQEPEGNLRRIADVAGMSYTDETLHLISHYPIYAVERGGVRFGYVAVGPGRVVADRQRAPAVEPVRAGARARRQESRPRC